MALDAAAKALKIDRDDAAIAHALQHVANGETPGLSLATLCRIEVVLGEIRDLLRGRPVLELVADTLSNEIVLSPESIRGIGQAVVSALNSGTDPKAAKPPKGV